MTLLKTTIDFIHVCRDEVGEERFSKFSKYVGFDPKALKPYRSSIEKIMDFIAETDNNCHNFDPKWKTRLSAIFHHFVSSDFRSMIILATTKQNYQLNILVRHFIEAFVVAFWSDMVSKYTDTLDYLLATSRWKETRRLQRLTWDYHQEFPHRSLKERLERIRLLNLVPRSGKRFYRYYFSHSSGGDIMNLISLPICDFCREKPENKRLEIMPYRLDPKLRRRGKEDARAKFKTDFGYTCSFCRKQRLTNAFVLGVPDVGDMLDMLTAITEDRFVEKISILSRLYDFLSREFVHFSFNLLPDMKKDYPFQVSNTKVSMKGFNAIVYTLDIVTPLLNYYFADLKKARKKRSRK